MNCEHVQAYAVSSVAHRNATSDPVPAVYIRAINDRIDLLNSHSDLKRGALLVLAPTEEIWADKIILQYVRTQWTVHKERKKDGLYLRFCHDPKMYQ